MSETQLLREQIDVLKTRQAALAKFGSFAFTEPDLQRVLTEATRVCAELAGVKHCKITQYREATNDLLIVAGVGWPDGIVNQSSFSLDAPSPAASAFKTG